MKNTKLVIGMVVLVLFALAACSSSQPVNNVMGDAADGGASNMDNDMANSSDNMMEENAAMNDSSEDMLEEESGDMAEADHDQGQMDEMADEDMMDEGSGEMVDSAKFAWYTHEFTDASTGETFRISDFEGKVVLVETLALWCSNCLRQQQQVKELHSLLEGRDDFVSVGINIDSREDLGMVARYINENGFDWYYGVAPDEIIGNISETLGGQFLNPPSTPIVLIDKEGNQFPLPFGIKTADTLLSYVEEHLN